MSSLGHPSVNAILPTRLAWVAKIHAAAVLAADEANRLLSCDPLDDADIVRQAERLTKAVQRINAIIARGLDRP